MPRASYQQCAVYETIKQHADLHCIDNPAPHHGRSVVIVVSESDGEVRHGLSHRLHLHVLIINEPMVCALHPRVVDERTRVRDQA